MKSTKSQIDAAVAAYNARRGTSPEWHREALRAALGTIRWTSIPELRRALDAYSVYRAPERWDGIPWGECGSRNHRAGIRAALNTLNVKKL